MKAIKRTHVIPLGFERSVAVYPLRVLGGNRAHIITIGGEMASSYPLNEKQRYFEEAVKRDLEKMSVEVLVHYEDLFDFKKAVGIISRVILDEKKEGNEVYVNISSHGRLVSVASALAGWHHHAKVYYVFPERYARDESEERKFGRSVCGTDSPIFEVPPISTISLSEEETAVLKLLYEEKLSGKSRTPLERIKKELENKFPDIYPSSEFGEKYKRRREEQKQITKINRRVLNKLEERGYILRRKVGRKTFLEITELGEFINLLESGSLQRDQKDKKKLEQFEKLMI